MKKTILALSFAIMISGACATPAASPSFSEHQTECISVGMDGKEMVRVWAKGRNKMDARMQCMKKAVYDVCFKGIVAGSTTADSRPVLNNPNIRDRYEDYFNLFFADGGDFLQYVSLENQYKRTVKTYKNNENYMLDMIVVVDRAALKKRFIDDNVLR